MADFARWATACEREMFTPGSFEQAYRRNRKATVADVIEADMVADAIYTFMRECEEWSGTAAGLADALEYDVVGEIPQVEYTHGFINTAYPCMNDRQLAIGESTFGGRHTLRSEEGLIDCQELVRLLVERCTSAREAIRVAGELTEKYGWNDEGAEQRAPDDAC